MTNIFDCQYIYKHDFENSCSIFEFFLIQYEILFIVKFVKEKAQFLKFM